MFICLGVFADKYVLSRPEALDVKNALLAGKHVYLEGSDTWCYDPQHNTLCPWFGVNPIGHGGGMSKVIGAAGTIVDGLSLAYRNDAEMAFIDVIAPASPADLLFYAFG